MKAIHLRTEHLKNPLGLDIENPQVSWHADGDYMQTACQMKVYVHQKLIWNSHKCHTSQMHMRYEGPKLMEATRYDYTITLWNENDEAGKESEGFFETGITHWQAQWITGDYTPKKKKRYPVDYFKKSFDVSACQQARLYITACGLYAVYINKQRVGPNVLAPGITDYRKRLSYQVYDVTTLLHKGTNELIIQLADGWYRGSVGAWGLVNAYGKETKVLAQLTYYDGNDIHIIGTDDQFLWSNSGAIRFADNKDGEIYDARNIPVYNRKARLTHYAVTPTASNNVPIVEHKPLSPNIITTPQGHQVLDFHQNIAGYISFSLKAQAGQTMTLRFGEMLDDEGEFTQKNFQLTRKNKTTPLQEIRYIAKEGENTYKTTFAIFGFQYVLVETEIPFANEDFLAIPVSSDLEKTASFTSSSPLLNQFFQNTYWSARNNACDLPTDCPTRERHGWSGDAQIFADSACYLFDYTPFAKKYLYDLYDWQKKNGCLPQIAPEGGVDFYMKTMNGSVGWADAGIIIPYVLYKHDRDPNVLEKFLPGMRKYLEFMKKRCGKWYLTASKTGLSKEENRYISNYGQAYGEWAEPDDIYHMSWKDCAVPHPEVATAYTIYMCELMSQIENLLGHHKQAQKDQDFANKCRQSYQALRNTKRYTLDTNRQAMLVRPLAFHLLNDQQTEYAKKRLLKALENYQYRIGTGFLSTPLILDVLSSYDLEAAYKLLENEKIPGWLAMPKLGATTIWEAWEGRHGASGIGSLDHYSKGAIISWLFETMCGINLEKEQTWRIQPRPGGHFTHAAATYVSPFGKVESSWIKEKGFYTFSVTIPTNNTATIILPDGSTYKQGPGKQTYTVKE